MPHLSIEYSANLDRKADIDGLCARLLGAVLETGLFEIGAVRIRTIRCEHYAIADRAPENAFVDLRLRIGAGRTPEQKTRAGNAIFAAAQEALAALSSAPHFALSLEIQEIDPRLSWKHNTMHTRLGKAGMPGERHVPS